MAVFNLHKDLEMVFIADIAGKAEKVITAAQTSGALFGTIIKSRGMIRQRGKRLLKSKYVTPGMESILMLTPRGSVENVLIEAAHHTGIATGSIGAVMSIPVSQLWATEYAVTTSSVSTDLEIPRSNSLTLNKNLRLITCICQQGKADFIAEAAVKEGSASPVIHYGEGKGVRDRMGMLKIAVNPVKEVIYVITDEFDCDRIFDAMVEAGKLYAPGMGFIYTTEIPFGIINLHTTVSGSHTEATTEQIIKAIDELKGSRAWRLADALVSSSGRPKRKHMTNLVNLKLVTRRGLGDEFIYKAMHRGAHGATRSFANLVGGELMKGSSGRIIADEREIIDFHVVPDYVESLLNAFEEIVAAHESKNSFLVQIPVPRAVTYFG